MSAVDTNDPKEIEVVTEYRVVVTRVQRNVKTRDRDYKDLGTKGSDGETEYGYVYFDTYKTIESEVYNQSVENLNMTEVIKAVNGMEK